MKLSEKAQAVFDAIQAADGGRLDEGHPMFEAQNELTCGDEFWYALTAGGYIDPADYLADPRDVDAVKDAVDVLARFQAVYSSVAAEV